MKYGFLTVIVATTFIKVATPRLIHTIIRHQNGE